MTLNGHFALNSVLCRYACSSEVTEFGGYLLDHPVYTLSSPRLTRIELPASEHCLVNICIVFVLFELLCIANRLDNFVVGLTNSDPAMTPPVYLSSYTLCGQYSGAVASSDTVTVVCSPSTEKFRYVIVHGSWDHVDALCLTEVYVYARSK